VNSSRRHHNTNFAQNAEGANYTTWGNNELESMPQLLLSSAVRGGGGRKEAGLVNGGTNTLIK